MAIYVWQLDMEPVFPLDVREYVAHGDSDRMHWHDHLEIALVLDGHGTFRFGRRAIAAEAGDVFFIDNSQPHVALADSGADLRLLLVLFRPELICGAGSRDLDLGYLAPFHADEHGQSPRIRGRTRLGRDVAASLRELRSIEARHDRAERHLADATLRRALALVNRSWKTGARGPRRKVTPDRREQIRPVLEYVDDHPYEHVTLEDVADVVHVSSSRIRHLFKDVMGLGFKEYVTHVRLVEAKRLLLNSDRSVADIAGAVSYTNLNQFYKVFYRSCAMSPAEYRRYYTPTSGIQPPAGGLAAGAATS